MLTLNAVILACAATAASQDKPSPEPIVRIVRLDKKFDALVPADALLEKLGDGYTWVEGPAWNRKGQYLLFSDIPANSVFMWKEGKGMSLFMKPSGYTGTEPFTGREPGSNGLTYDLDGRLVLCEHGDRRVTRVEADGHKTVLADRYNGKRLNSPNDVVVKSNGDVYFTDPPYGLPKTFSDPGRELDFCGVYRISTDGKITLLTKEIRIPNGLAFSPDEKKLYITDDDPDRFGWLVYDVTGDGLIENGRDFYSAAELRKTRPGSPDGLRVDKHGNIFSSGPGGIYVFTPDATLLGMFETGVPTSNCAWGEDGSTLFITANTAVYRIKLLTKGAGFE
jgi:gluconolactonase